MRGALHGPGVRTENHQQGQMQRQGKLEPLLSVAHGCTVDGRRSIFQSLTFSITNVIQFSFFLPVKSVFFSLLQEHMIQNEVAILRRVKHPNIVLLIEEVDTYNELYLVMELVKAGVHFCTFIPVWFLYILSVMTVRGSGIKVAKLKKQSPCVSSREWIRGLERPCGHILYSHSLSETRDICA